mgnify:FL=1
MISLTAPKLGVKKYADEGRVHWLGGRFIGQCVRFLPFSLASSLTVVRFCSEMNAKHELNLPEYPGSSQVVDITQPARKL